MRKTSLTSILQVALPAFVLVGYVLFPFGMVISESILANGSFSWVHYETLLSPSNTAGWEAVRNSVSVSLLSVGWSAIIGTVMAFGFVHVRFPFKRILEQLALLPIALPPLVGVIAFLFVFGESGFVPRGAQWVLGLQRVPFSLDGIPAIVAVHTYSFYVYFYLFVSNALRRLDPSAVEAAAALGASHVRILLRVVLPEIKPALVGASVLTFMASMASFSAPFLFGGDARFMTTQIYSSKLNGDMDAAAAQAVGLTVVSLAFFLLLRIFQRSEAAVMKTKGASGFKEMALPAWMKWSLVAFVQAVLVAAVLPILTIVLISFVKEGTWTWQILPTEYTIDNYSQLLTEPRIFEPVVNSLLMTCLAVAGALAVGLPAAYTIVKGTLKRWKTLADVFITMPFAIPGTVVALGLILAFNEPGLFSAYTVLVGTFWILPLAYLVRTFPLVVRSTAASLERFDDSLTEAGESFGAGPLQCFRRIMLPVILPGIVSGTVLVAIAALGEFVSSILLYTYANRPVSIEILSQLRGYHFGGATVYCVFLLLLIFGLTKVSSLVTEKWGRWEKSYEF